MEKPNIFDRIPELKEKFQAFFQHRKKIAALENYSSSVKFHHKSYLLLVKECLKDGFLGDEEAAFLDHMLGRYEINYLDWAHKTKWLKEQIKEKGIAVSHRYRPYQILFDFDKPKDLPVNVPVELIAIQSVQKEARI